MLDANGVITEQFVKDFRKFEGSPKEFIDFISKTAKCFIIEDARSEFFKMDIKRVRYITEGYSSYEKISSMIRNSYFGWSFWQSLHRGGMVVYEIPLEKWDEKIEDLGVDIGSL